MTYDQFNQVEEGDLIAKFNIPFYVHEKEDLFVTTFDNRSISYTEVTGLWKLDSKGNYMKVEVE